MTHKAQSSVPWMCLPHFEVGTHQSVMQILVFVQRFLGFPRGKHCKLLEGNRWHEDISRSSDGLFEKIKRFFSSHSTPSPLVVHPSLLQQPINTYSWLHIKWFSSFKSMFFSSVVYISTALITSIALSSDSTLWFIFWLLFEFELIIQTHLKLSPSALIRICFKKCELNNNWLPLRKNLCTLGLRQNLGLIFFIMFFDLSTV